MPWERVMFGDTSTMEMTFHYSRLRWAFPSDPFVEYEESDAEWARPLGFGREVVERYTVTYPQVIFTGFKDGEWMFQALASPCDPVFLPIEPQDIQCHPAS